METWRVSLAWGQVNRLVVGGNYVCCFVTAVVFMRLGGAKRGWEGLKPSHGGKLREEPQSQRRRGNFYGGADPSAILSELPTYFSLIWCKNGSMIRTS